MQRGEVLARVFAAFSAVMFFASPGPSGAETTVAGFTLGSFSVSPSGAAMYSMPIQAPPGTAGMQPRIALTYNSQGAGGLLGAGWALEGLSAISRCGRTIAQDGVNTGVTWTSEDRYCLDGQRLVAISGNYGAHGTEYRTERESFTRIISYSAVGTGPAYFKFWTKSGQIVEYGYTDDSRIEAQGKTSVRTYAINKVSDTKGNYMTFSYNEDNDNGDFSPARINYTGNDPLGVGTYASVRFEYQARTDNQPRYIAGSAVSTRSRLTNVKTYLGETVIKDYRLAYDYGAFAAGSRLLTVTECTAGGSAASCLRPTTFTWQSSSGGYGFASASTWGSGLPNSSTNAIADVNGDGIGDLIFANESGINVALSSGTGFGTPTVVVSGVYSFAAGDVNGDGKTDIVTATGQVYLGNGSGFTYQGSWGVGWSGSNVLRAAIADFNGDGLGDLMYAIDSTIYVAYSTGGGFATPYAVATDTSGGYNCPSGSSCFWSSIFAVGDVNGDGLADLVTGAGIVYSSTGTGFNSGPNWGTAAGTLPFFVADMNSDGLADLVYTSGTNIVVAHSTGVGFSAGAVAASDASVCASFSETGCTAYYAVFVPGDVNGDGRGDIVVGPTVYAGIGPTLGAITVVDNSLSHQTAISYALLSTGTSIYVPDSGAAWPVRDISPKIPLDVVSSASAANGLGGNFATNYLYRGAKAHLRGGGFMGFRQVEATDSQTAIKTVTTFRQDYPFHGLPITALKTQSSGAMLSQVANTWSDLLYSNSTGKYHRTDLTQSVESGNDLNGAALPTVTTTNSSIDNYGNVGQIGVSTGDGFSKTTTNTYSNYPQTWLLGRLTRSTVQSTAPDNSPGSSPPASGSDAADPPPPPPPGGLSIGALMAIIHFLLED